MKQPQKTYVTLDYRELQTEYAADGVELDIPGTKIFVVHTKEEQT